MRVLFWSAVAVLAARSVISCAQYPRYACVDQSHPCDGSYDPDAGDAGPDGDVGDAGDQ